MFSIGNVKNLKTDFNLIRWKWVLLFPTLAALLLAKVYIIFVGYAAANADLYVWPYFLNDLFSGGFDYAKWTLPPSGYLFPDLPVYTGLWFLTGGNAVWALLLQHFLYAGLFVWGTTAVLRRYAGWKTPESLFAAFFVALCITDPLLVPRAVMVGLMGPASHGQSAWWLLLGACAMWEAWQRDGVGLPVPPKKRSMRAKKDFRPLVYVGVIAFLGCFGDRIFPVWFVMPFALVAVLHGRWRLFLTLMIAGGCGALMAYNISPSTSFLYTPTGNWRFIQEMQRPVGAAVFWKDMLAFKHECPGFLLILATGLLLGIFYIGQTIKRLPWWTWGAVFLVFAPLVLSFVLGIYDSVDNWRHFPFIVFFALLLFAYFMRAAARHWKIFLAAFVFLPSVWMLPTVFVYSFEDVTYPSFTNDLDTVKHELGLKDGLGSYWFSKQTNLLTRNGSFLAPIWKDGRINPVLGTLRDYENKDFNYILPHTLWLPQLIDRFGPPSRIIELSLQGSGYRRSILIYPDGVLNAKIAADPLLQALVKQRKPVVSN